MHPRMVTVVACVLAVCTHVALADDQSSGMPAVNAGRPTLTDTASLTAPGWLETEWGLQRDLRGDLAFSTPLVLKLTMANKRLEYRLGTDAYVWVRDGEGGSIDGFGDMYLAAQYLLTRQSGGMWDTAARLTLKAPTASARRGIGSGRLDYGLLIAASRDLTPALHTDLNLAYTTAGRQGAAGTDALVFVSASLTMPIPHSRWQYSNEIAWQTAAQGSGRQVTTMHGVSYAVRPWDVWDVAINFGLTSAAPRYQVLFDRTFFLGRLF
jgi:hypothetical protein